MMVYEFVGSLGTTENIVGEPEHHLRKSRGKNWHDLPKTWKLIIKSGVRINN